MNILLVTRKKFIQFPFRSGVGIYNQDTIAFLESIGVNVDVVYGDTDNAHKDFVKYHEGSFLDLAEMKSLSDRILERVFEKHYEFIECGAYEALYACVSLGLQNIMPVLYRTHGDSLVFPDTSEHSVRMDHVKALFNAEPHIMLNCQTENGAAALARHFDNKAFVSYIPMPNLLKYARVFEKKKPKQEGIVYIARYETRKRVEEFADLVAGLNCTIRILTVSHMSAVRWTKLLKSKGLKKLDIRYNISTEEKFEMLASSKVAVNTALTETFGIGCVESMPFTPLVILENEANWQHNYDNIDKRNGVFCLDRKKARAKIEKLLTRKTSYTNAVPVAESYDALVSNTWKTLLKNADKFSAVGTSGKSELSELLHSGEVLDWSEFAEDRMFRKLKQLYCFHKHFRLGTKGSLIKKKQS